MNKKINSSDNMQIKDTVQTKDARCKEILGKRSIASVLMSLIKYHARVSRNKGRKHEAVLSVSWLAWKTETSERCVFKNLQKLIENGLIHKIKCPKNTYDMRDGILCDLIFIPISEEKNTEQSAVISEQSAVISEQSAVISERKNPQTLTQQGFHKKRSLPNKYYKELIRTNTPLPPFTSDKKVDEPERSDLKLNRLENFTEKSELTVKESSVVQKSLREAAEQEVPQAPKPINPNPNLSEMFKKFMEIYPKGTHSNANSSTAFNFFCKLIKNKTITLNELLDKTRKFAKTWEQKDEDRKFIPSACKWLTEARYEQIDMTPIQIPQTEANISLDPLIESFLVKTGNSNHSDARYFYGATAKADGDIIIISQPGAYFRSKITDFQTDLEKFFCKSVVIR